MNRLSKMILKVLISIIILITIFAIYSFTQLNGTYNYYEFDEKITDKQENDRFETFFNDPDGYLKVGGNDLNSKNCVMCVQHGQYLASGYTVYHKKTCIVLNEDSVTITRL